MATDVSIRFRADARQSRQEIQRLRGTLNQLNKAVVENRKALLNATGAERKRIQAVQAASAVQKAALQQQIREAQARKQAIAELQRETQAREQAARAAERAAEQSRQATQQLTAGLAIASGLAARQLGELTVGFVQAAANMETFRASLNAVIQDSAETDRVLARLLAVSVDLVGIDTGDLINYAARLMSVGISADDTISAISGVTKRLAEQGRPAHEVAGSMEQVAQSFNTGTLVMQDLRPLLRVMPTFWRDATNALGETVRTTDDFNRVAAASGGHTQTLLRVLAEMERASQGADLSTLNAQIDILQDQSRILAAELGQHLIPAVVFIIRQINDWIEVFNNMGDNAQRAIVWAVALATGLTALTAVVGGTVVAFGALSASLAAITGASGLAGVASLVGQAAGGLGRIVGVLGRVGSVGNLAATSIITLTQAWQMIYDAFQRTPPFEDAQESVQALDVAASQTARSLGITAESFANISEGARNEIGLLISRADELRNSITNAINKGDTQAAAAFRQEYRRINEQLTALVATAPEASAAIRELGSETRPLITTTENLTGVLRHVDTRFLMFRERAETLSGTIRELPAEITAVRGEFDVLAPTAARVNAIFTEYNETLNQFVATSGIVITNFEKESEALDEVSQRIIQLTQDAEGLAHVYEVLERRTDAHNAALVNPAVTRAAASLRRLCNRNRQQRISPVRHSKKSHRTHRRDSQNSHGRRSRLRV